MNFAWRKLLFTLVSVAALAYLAIANARGYVPFVGTTQHGSGGGGGHGGGSSLQHK